MRTLFLRTLAVAAVAASLVIVAAGGAQASTLHAAGPTPRLEYYGGRVLPNAEIDVVVWGRWSYGRTVPLTGARSMTSFLAGVGASPYFDWLREYDTPTQHIGHGHVGGVFTITPPPDANGGYVGNTRIAEAMKAAIASGSLPRPNGNRVYVVFTRAGQVVVAHGRDSQHDFCAYHDTVSTSARPLYYAVIPYELTNPGCRPATNAFDDVTTVVSHELVEAVTDPGVGSGRVAWYDRINGEIGDICAATKPAAIIGTDGVQYVVQREWSNTAKRCIVTR